MTIEQFKWQVIENIVFWVSVCAVLIFAMHSCSVSNEKQCCEKKEASDG